MGVKTISIITMLLAAIVAPMAGSAQSTSLFAQQVAYPTVSSLPFIGSLPEVSLEHMSWSARAAFGWKHLGLNYSLNLGYQNFGVLQQSPLEIAISQTYLWTGKVDTAVKISRHMRLFGSLELNTRSKVPVSTPAEPAHADFDEPAVWRGSHLEWWALDGGVTYDLARDWRMVAGLRHDHLQMELKDPVNLAVPGDFSGDDYSASFQSKIWIPYVGVEVVGKGYSAALVASSIASISFQVPFRYLQAMSDDDEAFYSLSADGYFLEGSFNYVMLGNATFASGIWTKASLMRFKGAGQEGLVNSSGAPLERTISGFSTYSRYEYAIGLCGTFNF